MPDPGDPLVTSLSLAAARLRSLPIRSSETWEIALAVVPAGFRGRDRFVPTMALACCVNGDGFASMSDPCSPDNVTESAAVDALTRLALDPLDASGAVLGHLPARVLAGPMPAQTLSRLQQVLGDLGVTVEGTPRTPNVDDVLDVMLSRLLDDDFGGDENEGDDEDDEDDEDDDDLYLPSIMDRPSMTIARVRAFCHAAADFHEAAPWRWQERERCWSISPRPHRRSHRHVVVIGLDEQTIGLSFLARPPRSGLEPDDLRTPEEMFAELGGETWSITFDTAAHLPFEEFLLYPEHGFEIAGTDAFPLAAGFTPEGVQRPGSSMLAFFEGILRAMASMRPADVRRGHFTRTVETYDGPRTFTLTEEPDRE